MQVRYIYIAHPAVLSASHFGTSRFNDNENPSRSSDPMVVIACTLHGFPNASGSLRGLPRWLIYLQTSSIAHAGEGQQLLRSHRRWGMSAYGWGLFTCRPVMHNINMALPTGSSKIKRHTATRGFFDRPDAALCENRSLPEDVYENGHRRLSLTEC